MATELTAYHTLIEFGNRHKNKLLLDIVESMKSNPLVKVGIWREGNGLTSHRHSATVSYPSASSRQVGKGATPSNAQVLPVDEPILAFESQVDIDVIYEKFEKNFEQYRYDEELKHLEGMSRSFMEQFFYGVPGATIGDINGLGTRYNLTSMANVTGEGGTGSDTSSVWMLKMGADGLFMVYPTGDANHGISREPMGKVRNSSYAWMWNTVFGFTFGLCVSKDVAVQRLANIDSGATLDPDNLVTMATNIMGEYGSYEGVVLLMNARCWGMLWKEANATPGLLVKGEDPFGNPVWMFDGIPIYLCGGLVEDEDAIT